MEFKDRVILFRRELRSLEEKYQLRILVAQNEIWLEEKDKDNPDYTRLWLGH